MIIKTRNSTYRITPLHTNFEVEKIAESTPNPNEIEMGWKYTCKAIRVMVGESAYFGGMLESSVGVHTSIVMEVYNERHETQ